MTDELRALADAAVDGTLSADQAARLEAVVLADPAACRWFAEYAHLIAALRTAAEPPVTVPAPRRRHRWGWAAVAAGVLAAGPLTWWATRGPAEVATLTEAKACKWEAGTLPTAVGVPLPAGRLRLAEGLARLTFASGAELTVEGPADLELRTPFECVLHAGQVTAKVPPPASGFVVRTPQSVVTDYGTEFGVTVRDGHTADVLVFDGSVEVAHPATGTTESLTPQVGGRRYGPAGAGPLEVEAGRPPTPAAPVGTRVVSISTAQGRGRDGFVQPMPAAEVPADRRTDTLLLLKRGAGANARWTRKAYLGFDLRPLAGRPVRDAELTVTFAPTGMGFAAQVPDCTFTAWGLTGPADWDERTLVWDAAPANRPDADLDPARVVRLGAVVLPQGEQAGTQTFAGPAVADWLRAAGEFGTVVLVRDTLGTSGPRGSSDLVHGVASRRHPTLAPPTLRVTVADRRE